MMIERKKYVEPEVKFNRFTLDRSIANVCWGYAARNEPGDYDPLFYDYSGKGYIQFNVSGIDKGSCKGGDSIVVDSITYHNIPTDEQEQASTEFYKWFEQINANPPAGSPYLGDRFSEDNPGKWS